MAECLMIKTLSRIKKYTKIMSGVCFKLHNNINNAAMMAFLLKNTLIRYSQTRRSFNFGKLESAEECCGYAI